MGNERPSVSSPPLLEDVYLVSFLRTKGYEIRPLFCRDDPYDFRVGFEVNGEQAEIEQHIQSYYNNEQLGVQDFIRTLRDVKSMMHHHQKLGKK